MTIYWFNKSYISELIISVPRSTLYISELRDKIKSLSNDIDITSKSPSYRQQNIFSCAYNSKSYFIQVIRGDSELYYLNCMNNGYDEPRVQSILQRTLVRVSQNKGKHKGTYQTNLTKQQHKKLCFVYWPSNLTYLFYNLVHSLV
jgi:hypothetical protein